MKYFYETIGMIDVKGPKKKDGTHSICGRVPHVIAHLLNRQNERNKGKSRTPVKNPAVAAQVQAMHEKWVAAREARAHG